MDGRTFNELAAVDRLVAVLGVLPQPVSRQLALSLADVEEQTLNPDEQIQVEQLFEGSQLEQHTSPQYGTTYRLTARAKKEATHIDWANTKRQFKSLLAGSLFG